MAITRMQKISLLCHEGEKERLLEGLQELGILQFSLMRESPLVLNHPELLSPPETLEMDRENRERLEKRVGELEGAISFLSNFEEKGFLESLNPPKVLLSPQEEERIVEDYDSTSIIEKIRTVEERGKKLVSRRNHLQSQLESLLPWESLEIPLESLSLPKRVILWTGILPEKEFPSPPPWEYLTLHVEEVNRVGKSVFVLVAFPSSEREEIESFLKEIHFERISLEGFQGRPLEAIERIELEMESLEREKERLLQEGRSLLSELPKLKVLYDHSINLLNQRNALNEGLFTRRTFLIEGWVRRGDLKRIRRFLENFETVSFSEVLPYPGENPPVELRNQKIFKPFEVVTELYGMPHPSELDPTPLLAPFFAIFFGLCLTDAGYGILLSLFAYLLLRKFPRGRRFFQLFLFSGLVTTVMGAITGGWFGDGFDRIPLPILQSFKNSLVLFDPLKTPMVFLLIACGLGYLQVNFGLLVGLYKNILKKAYEDSIFGQVPWLLLLNSLLIWILSRIGILPVHLGRVASFIALGSALTILLFSDRSSRNPLVRLAFGFLSLYGITSYAADVLSYVRLLALGLVTGILAMVVNILADLATGIPIIGVLLAVLILIGGHLFNLALNSLGAFVHTLRLQFVEFFPKFYQGNGRPFKPFTKSSKYTLIR